MESGLRQILQVKREEIASQRARTLPSPPVLRPCDLKRDPGEPLRILAEIKLKSPSAGALSTRLTVANRAACYERAGASMVSVLCDFQFFGGSYDHLTLVRQACNLPVLCKEFVVDEIQLDWARAYGADAVLLIARCVTRDSFERLYKAAIDRGLLPLVEIASLDEAKWVGQLDVGTIGVNARDLDTLQLDPERASNVLASLPNSRVRIHLSGLKAPHDVVQVSQSGVDAALIGEVLMLQDDPEPLLSSFVKAAR